MKILSRDQLCAIIRCLCDGVSVATTTRITGVAKNTIQKLTRELGQAVLEFQDHALRNLPRKRVELDEIWEFQLYPLAGMSSCVYSSVHYSERRIDFKPAPAVCQNADINENPYEPLTAHFTGIRETGCQLRSGFRIQYETCHA